MREMPFLVGAARSVPGAAPFDEMLFAEQYLALLDGQVDLAATLDVEPQEMDACYQEALQAYAHGAYAEAASSFSLLTLLQPGNGALYLAMGSAVQQLGDAASALRYFSLAVQCLPDDAGAHFRLAECQCALGQAEAARNSLRTCLHLCATRGATGGLYPHATALWDRLQTIH